MSATTSSAETTPAPGEAESEVGIVVGLDESDAATHAFRWAVARAPHFGPIRPVTAWLNPWWYYVGAPMIAPDGPGPDIAHAAERMVEQITEHTDPDILAEAIVAKGSAGRVLVDVARTASLLVVGTRGRSAASDAVLGSVSSYCAAHATVPLVVVPEDVPADAGPGRIVVGIDGSAGSDAALDWAIANAGEDDHIVAFRSWDIPALTGYEGIAIDPEVVERSTVEAAAQQVGAACVRAGVPAGRVEVKVAEGDTRVLLQKESMGAAMLVLGRRGHSRIMQLLIGSVATALVHQPHIPTVIVPSAH